ncbi:MAG: ABC transporter permease, partial [Prolixibacteraceae bacterium]|nr:ABC transporter permease [Prolixibacteraceae bacterium]
MILKVVTRNLQKHPFLNLIKVIGLSLALSGIVFIVLFLKSELSYDKYFKNAERIYRYSITDSGFFGGRHFARIINPVYIPDLKEAISEIENFVRLRPVRGGLMKYGDRYYGVNQAFECDSTFFQVFDAEILVGDKNSVLENPASMVVTESFARKVFGDSNPVGEILTIPPGQYYGQAQDFTIQGIIKDFPSNSHFHPDFLATPVQDQLRTGWAWTYLLLTKNASPENVKAGIANFFKNNTESDSNEIKTQFHLQKLTDIHLNSHKLREIEPNGYLRNIYVLAIAAIILLLIAISNFANLSLGMSGFSSKYLFVNKILGSSKHSVLNYFFIEGLFIVLATILLVLLISFPVNSIIYRVYGLNLLSNNLLLLFLIFLIFSVVTLLFGLMPVLRSVFLSIRNEIQKNTSSVLNNGKISRTLIVFQYGFSIALIIAVIVITKQTKYALNSSLGVKEDNVICLESVHASLQQKFGVLKEELLKYNS